MDRTFAGGEVYMCQDTGEVVIVLSPHGNFARLRWCYTMVQPSDFRVNTVQLIPVDCPFMLIDCDRIA